MSVSLIAAIGRNNELGRNNDLIWHFKEDMKFFKETTVGSTVIMGRKTFESLPKALPKRRNIVITSDKSYQAEGAEIVSSVDEALKASQGERVFVIGGAKVYCEMLGFCDKLYLTEIESECENADTFFPSFDKSLYTREVLNEYTVDSVSFSHVLYTKKK